MSASLVGSEMCIRDSVWECPSVRARGASWTAHGWPGAGRARRPPPHRSCCLLYTSDAADDM
eukprot:342250-Alexandrium_andersonii.AAC.1